MIFHTQLPDHYDQQKFPLPVLQVDANGWYLTNRVVRAVAQPLVEERDTWLAHSFFKARLGLVHSISFFSGLLLLVSVFAQL